MNKRRKRRTWSDDEKGEICHQTTAPGVSVAQVARRYSLNANMIHTWLKDDRFAPVGDHASMEVADTTFLELEVAPSAPMIVPASPQPPSLLDGPVSVTRVDITLSDRRRILIEGPTAPPTIGSLVQGLVS